MTNINHPKVNLAFEALKNMLLANPLLVSQLEQLKPEQHEMGTLEWRYRLKGFIEGLCAAKLLDAGTIRSINDMLFGDEQRKYYRPGKLIHYSVDILTEQGKIFVFDVPSTNPTDAYFQVTKRTAYKVIPDIISVSVYLSFMMERASNRNRLKLFSQDELVFVSLF